MRKFIDLINEFQMTDVEKHLTTDGGGLPPIDTDGDGSQKIEVFNIIWDVDDHELEHLPTRVVTTMHDVEEAADPYADPENQDNLMYKIGDWLTRTYSGNLSDFGYSIGW